MKTLVRAIVKFEIEVPSDTEGEECFMETVSIVASQNDVPLETFIVDFNKLPDDETLL